MLLPCSSPAISPWPPGSSLCLLIMSTTSSNTASTLGARKPSCVQPAATVLGTARIMKSEPRKELKVWMVGTWYDSVLSPIPPGDFGNWVFLAGTFDGANWNLYRNGVL